MIEAQRAMKSEGCQNRASRQKPRILACVEGLNVLHTFHGRHFSVLNSGNESYAEEWTEDPPKAQEITLAKFAESGKCENSRSWFASGFLL